MDIRMEKTENAIKNAFMELRSKKPLEKITVKELCALACINKSTFYAHYEDIYALSDTLETETVASVLKSIPHAQTYSFENLDVVTRELCLAFISHISLINVLFSGKGQSYLTNKLEAEIKRTIFEKYPEYKDDAEKNILLSYCVHGAYYAYVNNQNADTETLLGTIERIVKAMQTLLK
ncbi:MAG: TetR/AcrR family transcriptional regulator [Eubacterium sp.]|nr:TetR/AcrR family transcriptional regulator [Eubacterium sp.]